MRDDKRRSLSAAQQQLVDMIRRVRFGRIERLVVRYGEPIFIPPPQTIREVKFGSEPVSREADGVAFSPQATELFSTLAEIGDGVVDLEVRHALPFKLNIIEREQP